MIPFKIPTTVEEVKAEEERQARELAAMSPEQRAAYLKRMDEATKRSWKKLLCMIEGAG